jgi:hypothetical protein
MRGWQLLLVLDDLYHTVLGKVAWSLGRGGRSYCFISWKANAFVISIQ